MVIDSDSKITQYQSEVRCDGQPSKTLVDQALGSLRTCAAWCIDSLDWRLWFRRHHRDHSDGCADLFARSRRIEPTYSPAG